MKIINTPAMVWIIIRHQAQSIDNWCQQIVILFGEHSRRVPKKQCVNIMMSLELYVEIGRSLTTKMLRDSHEGTHEKKAMKTKQRIQIMTVCSSEIAISSKRNLFS